MGAEFNEVAVECGKFERLAEKSVLEHRGSSAGRIGSERDKYLLGIDFSTGSGCQGERFGQDLFGPNAVARFAKDFQAAAGQGG